MTRAGTNETPSQTPDLEEKSTLVALQEPNPEGHIGDTTKGKVLTGGTLLLPTHRTITTYLGKVCIYHDLHLAWGDAQLSALCLLVSSVVE